MLCVRPFNAVLVNQCAMPRTSYVYLKSTVVTILHKWQKLYAYKVQIVQSLQPDDGPRRASFATEIMSQIYEDDYFKRVCFSYEATFHTSGVVNRYNVSIWGT